MLSSAKRFRIEDEARLSGAATGVPPSPGGTGLNGVERSRPSGRPEPGPKVARGGSAAALDIQGLRAEILAMKDAIALTKSEIASLQRSGAGANGMHRAASELDAVAEATERAATTILGAVEEIETAAGMLRASGLDTGRNDFVGTIMDRVVLLYETCNFQDITGQRIAKVVTTLKFVEERLDIMIGAWGRPQPGATPDEPVRVQDEPDRALVRGPSLPGDEQVTQTDIDAFFG